MPKKGLEIHDLPRLVPEGKNWSLCIGAGTSAPVFPKWDDLAKELAKELFDSNNDVSQLLKEFRADALIQAIYNKSQLPNEEYCAKLSKVLYKGLQVHLTEKEKDIVFDCLSDRIINNSILNWSEYIKILKNKFGVITAIQLAEIVIKSVTQDKMPKSILSFNAEPLLYSLINAFAYTQLGTKTVFMDLVNQSITSLYKDRISYVFCHGTLPIPGAKKERVERFTALEKLVFLENEYLQLSNTAYSWQSSSFINTLSSSIVFFVGVSLTDPNMRRWLAWTHECKLKELSKKIKDPVIDSNSHYWINKEPKDADLKEWYEASVSHLGIRIIWVSDWSEISIVLHKAIGLETEKKKKIINRRR